MELATIALVIICAALFYLSARKEGSFGSMPGPFRLPIFGNVQFDFPRLHMQFTEYARRYGELYRIQILSRPAVIINSYRAFKEAYSTNGRDFVGRPHALRFETIGASSGVAFSDFSPEQAALRSKFARAVGMNGQIHLERLVNENVVDLVQLFRAQNGQPFEPQILIKKFLLNIILSLLFGEKLDYEDEALDKLVEFNRAAVEAATIGREDVDVWRWTRHFNPNYKLAQIARQRFEEAVLPLYHKYEATYIEGHRRGVIDQSIADLRAGIITPAQLEGTLIDYLIGGVETTATTLTGFLLILLNSPKVQQRLQTDVDEVVGRDREVHVSDRPSLPYAEACVLELLRYQSVLPILVPRRTIRDTVLCGYRIPADTWVYTNAWAIHHDKDVYEKPYAYAPERFLDENGALVGQDHILRKSLVSFGLGKRKCIGETFAKTRLFLTLSALMQNFSFEVDEDHPPPSDDARDYKLKIIFDIAPYRLRAVSR